MPDRATELTAFMAEYERAANGHHLERIPPLIADDATYWFTDGAYRGREEIAGALERTPSGCGRCPASPASSAADGALGLG
jgi:hypothetical protein